MQRHQSTCWWVCHSALWIPLHLHRHGWCSDSRFFLSYYDDWSSFSDAPALILTGRAHSSNSLDSISSKDCNVCGCYWITAYHLYANEMVKWLDRALKAFLVAQPDPHNLACHLLLVLLSVHHRGIGLLSSRGNTSYPTAITLRLRMLALPQCTKTQ